MGIFGNVTGFIFIELVKDVFDLFELLVFCLGLRVMFESFTFTSTFEPSDSLNTPNRSTPIHNKINHLLTLLKSLLFNLFSFMNKGLIFLLFLILLLFIPLLTTLFIILFLFLTALLHLYQAWIT
jgi:hypothetical protein